MSPATLEMARMVDICYRLAKSDNTDELVAVACTIRNHVVPRPLGLPASYKTYSEAIDAFASLYPLRDRPLIDAAVLVDPNEGLLGKVEAIYTCQSTDITSSVNHPNGARYFCDPLNIDPMGWIAVEILGRQEIHPLIGRWGAQNFYI